MKVAWNDVTNKPEKFPPEEHSHDNATENKAGFMTGEDKEKLDKIEVSTKEDIENMVSEIFK